MFPVSEAIQSRRTIFHFKPEQVARDVLEEVLAAGIWAPNHRLTEPWRFTVIGEQTKLKLAERYRQIQIEKVANSTDVDESALSKVGEKGFEKFMSKPTVVVVSCLQEGGDQQQREDYAATCCALYCIQLAGWERGIGMQWSTGPITLERQTYELLGIDADREYIVGFCYVGYPADVPTPKRKPLHDVLHWTV